MLQMHTNSYQLIRKVTVSFSHLRLIMSHDLAMFEEPKAEAHKMAAPCQVFSPKIVLSQHTHTPLSLQAQHFPTLSIVATQVWNHSLTTPDLHVTEGYWLNIEFGQQPSFGGKCRLALLYHSFWIKAIGFAGRQGRSRKHKWVLKLRSEERTVWGWDKATW